MFTKSIYMLFLIAVSLTACEEKAIEPQKPDIYWGECTAVLNGVSWESCSYAHMKFDGTDFINILGDKYNVSQILIESLSIINVPLNEGTYQIDDWKSHDRPFALFTFSHADLALADYFVQEGVTAKGSVSLTAYDSVSREVEGYFDCVLYLVQKPGKPDAPDSLVFTDGYFHTRILE